MGFNFPTPFIGLALRERKEKHEKNCGWVNANRTNNKLWFWTHQGEFASHYRGVGVHRKLWPIQSSNRVQIMCLLYATISGIWEWSGSVAWFTLLPPLHTRLSKGKKRTNKQPKNHINLSLRKKGEVLNPFEHMLPRKPLLAILFILFVCLWKEVTLGICYCIGYDLSQLFIYTFY